MKTLFKVLIITTLVWSNVAFGQNEWHKLSYSNWNYSSVQFTDSTTGYMVSSKPEILKTTDGGFTWNPLNISLNTTNTLYKYFVNNNVGYVLSNGNLMSKTIDGGVTWNTFVLPTNNKYASGLFFINENNGYVIGENGLVLKTTSGGLEWKNYYPNVGDLDYIYFTDSNNGYIGNGNFIYRTTDGGSTWSKVYQSYMDDIRAFHAISTHTLIAVGYNIILKTSNGGSSWSEFEFEDEIFNSVCFADNQFGIAVGYSGKARYTFDGGNTWSTNNLLTNPGANTLFSIHFKNRNEGIAVGYRGAIVKFGRNYGHQIMSMYGGLDIYDVCFNDSNTGYLVGNKGVIGKTYDGGGKWIFYDTKTNSTLKSIDLLAGGTAFVCGESGIVFKSSNDGNVWNKLNTGFTGDLNGIDFVNNDIGYVVGMSGLVAKTIDGGATWQSKTITNGGTLSSIFTFNADTAFIASSDGKIYKTTNGGDTWLGQNAGANWLNSIYFSDINTGFAHGDWGQFIKTTNGGTSWTKQPTGTSIDLYSSHFTSPDGGFLIGNGKILKTDNGGATWVSELDGQFRSSCKTNDNLGYAVGKQGLVAKLYSRPLINITSQPTGSFLQIGATSNITWTTQTEIPDLNVNLFYSTDGGTTWVLITKPLASLGSYSWVVPNVVSNNCKIKIARSASESYAESPIFSIGNEIHFSNINILPNEALNVGSVKYLKWNTNAPIQGYKPTTVKLEYSTNGGTNWSVISTLSFETNVFMWTIPNASSQNCKFRISDAANSQINTESAVFTIMSVAVPYKNIDFYTNITPHSSNPGNLVQVGKRVRFKIQTTNKFSQNLMTLKGTIRTNSPFITVTDSVGNYNNLAQGQSNWNSDFYEVEMGNQFPENGIVEFLLIMTDEIFNAEKWITTFFVPFIDLSKVLVNDDMFQDSWGNGNNAAEPGETVEIMPLLRNNTSLAFTVNSDVLTSSDNTISIWNNRIGSTHTVRNTNLFGSLTANTDNLAPSMDYVFDMAEGNTSPQFHVQVNTTVNNIVLKYGFPFTLTTGLPIAGNGQKPGISGGVTYSRMEFYNNVVPNPENPQNLFSRGRIVRFKVKIENKTNRNMMGLAGNITTLVPGVIISDGYASFNNVATNASQWSVDEFEIIIPSELPATNEILFTLTVTDPFTENGIWTSTFSIPILKAGIIVIDDDSNPDSNGNDNDIAETGETIEVIPVISNPTNFGFYQATGMFISNVNYITVWDKVQGSSEMVYNSSRYNVVSGTHSPIPARASAIMPEKDFVFTHNGQDTSKLEFTLLTTAYLGGAKATTWETGGIKMVFSLPYIINPTKPEDHLVITSPLPNAKISKGNIVTICANAHGTQSSTVSKIDFYIDNALLGTDTEYPYSFDWNTSGFSGGQRTIKAVMTDSQNNTYEQTVQISLLDTYFVNQGAAFEFTLPANAFTFTGSGITYATSLVGDYTAPTWLLFNSTTKKYSGTAPVQPSVFNIRTRATQGVNTQDYEFFVNVRPTTAIRHSIVFSLFSENTPVPDAGVTINGHTFLSNAQGDALVELPDGNYSFTITCDGYDDYSGTLVVSGFAKNVRIELVPNKFPVTFNVKCGSSVLEGAVITIGPLTQTTNALGVAEINVANGIHNYTVSKIGYATVTGSFTMAGSDTLINVAMTEFHCNLTVNIVGQGSVKVNNVLYSSPIIADGGATISLEAIASEGYAFSGWTGSVAEATEATTTITMTSDKTVTATFTEIPLNQYTLTINVVGNGTVNVDGTTYTEAVTVDEGTELNLVALAADGWEFDSWTGSVTEPLEASTTILMDGNKTITATFSESVIPQYTLTVNIAGLGNVKVNGMAYFEPITVNANTVLNITAVTANGYAFSGWTGSVASATEATTTVTMTENRTITATFTEIVVPQYTLTVNIAGQGNVKVNGLTYFAPITVNAGTVLNLQALSASGWEFDSWTGSVASATEATTTVTMNENRTVTATFTEIEVPQHALTINLVGQGSVNVNGSPYTAVLNFTEGTVVNLSALSATGWEFSGWTGAVASATEATTTVTMTENRTITATFTEIVIPQYTLTLNIAGQGNVKVNGLTYFAPITVNAGTVLNLQALSANGWEFDSWTGSVASATESTTSVTMTENRIITATFTEIVVPQYTLTLNIAGQGNVKVNGLTYIAPITVNAGTVLNLQALSANGWEFDGWTGAVASATEASTTVTMTENRTVTATFTEIVIPQYTLTLNIAGQGNVKVNGLTYFAPITVNEGTVLNLQALSANGWEFDGWTGSVASATEATTTVTMTENRTITATFTEIVIPQYTLTLNIAGQGNVKVNGLTYFAPITVNEGTVLNLQALSASGWEFDSWTGSVASATEATTTVTMTENRTITATFTEIVVPQYTLTVNIAGQGNVKVNGLTYFAPITVNAGTVLNLQALSANGWEFSGWTGSVASATEATTTVTMTENRTITATFTEIVVPQYTLTVNIAGQGNVKVNGLTYFAPITVNAGTVLNLQALSANGWEFSGWTGSVASATESTTSVTMTENRTITATFTEIVIPQYALTINFVGQGSVNVNGSPYTEVLNFTEGTVVNLSAHAANGWEFDSWTGSVASATEATTTVTMTENRTVTATFTETVVPQYTLTINLVGQGSVNVNGSPYTAVRNFTAGTVVNLSALAASGWEFDSWTGSVASATEATTTVTMTENRTITATFTEIVVPQYTLTINVVGQGSVNVNGSPYTEVLNFTDGTVVNLSALSANGWEFDSWTGSVASATEATTTVTMTENRTVTATFTEIVIPQYTLTLNIAGQGNVKVNGLTYFAPITVNAGTVLNLQALSASGWEFSGWTGSVASATEATTTVTMTENRTITATFTEIMIPQYTLTINVLGQGSVNVNGSPYTAVLNFTEGTVVNLSALAANGWEFDSWTGPVASTTESSTTVTMTENRTITATFTEIVIPQYRLTVNIAGQGNVKVNGLTYFAPITVNAGTVLNLQAFSANGWEFSGWTGSVASATEASTTITMTENRTITATFTEIVIPQYTLTINVVGQGSVNVNGSPYTEVLNFTEGTVVNLSAFAANGWEFDSWTGSVASATEATTTVTMTENRTVTATFTEIVIPQYTLTLNIAGQGNVKVNGLTYFAPITVNAGTVLNLQALSANGWEFDSWTGSVASATEASTTVTMTENRTITATFTEIVIPQYRLTVNIAGQGNVKVNGLTYFAPITVNAGTVLNLQAFSANGWEFSGWTGSVASATEASTTITMTENRTITATFTEIVIPQYTLTINVVGQGSVNVNGSPYTGVLNFTEGTVVNLSAHAASGWEFDGWTGSVASATEATTTVTMTGNRTITATFNEIVIPQYTLTINVVGQGSVNVNGSPYTEVHNFTEGTVVNLSAHAASGWEFDGWTGSVASATEASTTVTMTENRTITATFTEIVIPQYALTINFVGQGSVNVNGSPYTEVLNFTEGTVVNLSAHAANGWEFDSWTGSVASATEATTTVTMTENRTVTATFTEIEVPQYTLTINLVGQGSVNVNGSPYTAVRNFTAGTVVNLSALAAIGWEFSGWTGSVASATEATTTVTMTENRTITATFTEIVIPQYTLTLHTFGNGTVKVNGTLYTHTIVVEEGSILNFSAFPTMGSSFVNWTDNENNIISSERFFQITMPSSSVTISAHFTPNLYNVYAFTNPFDGGDIIGSGDYLYGQPVLLSAQSYLGYEFVSWTDQDGNVLGYNEILQFIMPAFDMTLSANFELIDYNVTATINPENAGTVSGAGVYNMGNEVTLTATANAGYAFVNWTNEANEIVSVDAAYTFTMPAADVALNANFREKISATINPTTGTFDENSPENLSTVITWNDAASVTAITIVVEGETVELIANEDYTITDIDGLTAELTFLMGAKYAPATKGEMDIPCTITFDYGTNAVYTIHYIFVDFWNVAFNVTSSGSPVANATISIAGEELTTDDNGQAMTELENGVYDYTIIKDGYVTYQGSVTVSDEDAEVNVELVSGIGGTNVTLTKLYPNPVVDVVTLERNTTEQVTLEVYTNSGTLVETLTWNTQTLQLNVAGYKNGVFHIRILGNSVENLRFIKQ